VDRDALVGLGELDGGEVLGGGVSGEDGVKDVLHVGVLRFGVSAMLLGVNLWGHRVGL